MNRTVLGWAAPLVAVASLLLVRVPAATAAPEVLPDSNTVEQWTLANGLRVTTRHIPGAQAVAITIGYGSGTAADPAGREGLAWLLGEVQFMGAAGGVPERTRFELDGLRPLGWGMKVLPRATMFIELASPQQFPGVLHQSLLRLRGVKVTPALIKSALGSVRADLSGLYRTDPNSVVYALPRELAAGADAAAIGRLATASGLGALTQRDVERLLRERFVPANAVLSLAGDLKGIDLHAFLERECAGLPGGRAPAAATIRLQPAAATWRLPGLAAGAGVVAVIAPEVTDADHPEFYLAMLLMGSRARSLWGAQVPPLSSRFKFSLFDDPDLVRFYPPMDPEQGDTTWVAARLEEVIDPMARTVLPPDVVDGLKRGVYWMLGGPMMPDMQVQSRTDTAVLANLTSSMAMRALWQPESFWADYRRRFGSIQTVPLDAWTRYAIQRSHQVRLAMPAAAD